MSLRRSMEQLRPARKPKQDVQEKVQSFLTESSLSKAQLEKPAGKGPNSGTPRIEIFANKITKYSLFSFRRELHDLHYFCTAQLPPY